jgi:ligand-binding sensor domain-containing protein
MLRLFYIILFYLCIIPLALMAQEPFMRHYTVKDGLPQQQIMCYFKDSRGFLWLGTKNGLSRFDGKIFKNFNEEDGITQNQIRSIGEDEKGNIWLSTVYGLIRFDGKTFKTFSEPSLDYTSITVINSRKIVTHSKDWVLFENERYVSKADYFKGVDSKNIKKTYYDTPSGNMYVGCGDADKVVIHRYENGQLKKIGPPNLDFSDMQRLPNSTLLFGRFIPKMEKGVLNKLAEYQVYVQNDDGTFKLLCRKSAQTLELFDALPYDVFTGYAREKEQFFIPKGKKGVFKPMINPVPTARFELGVTYQLRSCNFYTSELGYIWVDSEQGLWQVFNEAFESIKNKDLDNVWAITKDKQENLYFATLSTAAIIKYDGQQFKMFFDGKNKSNPLPIVGFYYSASTDGNNNLYFPHDQGILKYDGQRFSQIVPIDTTTDKNYYLCSFYDEKRNWLIGGTDYHIEIFDLTNNTVQTIKGKQNLPNNLEICGFVKDPDESLWILGLYTIAQWQPEAHTFKTYGIINERGVKVGGIAGCIDERGTLWVGNASGLCYFDRQKNSFEWLTTELKHIVHAVVNYDKDHLMIGTTSGLIYLLDLNEWYKHKKVSLKLFECITNLPIVKFNPNFIRNRFFNIKI